MWFLNSQFSSLIFVEAANTLVMPQIKLEMIIIMNIFKPFGIALATLAVAVTLMTVQARAIPCWHGIADSCQSRVNGSPDGYDGGWGQFLR